MNRRKYYFISIILVAASQLNAQLQAYEIFTEKGSKVRYEKMVNDCKRANLVFFGEEHNNPVAHWMQLELAKELYADERVNLVIGAEMFETDGQLIIDEYFSGLITREKFEDDIRLWPNYKTDYKPLVEFAKEKEIKFVATNIPRRYANSVYKFGLDSLEFFSDEAKQYMMPVPFTYDTTINCYSSLAGSGPMGGHGGPRLRDAQAVKDATMAYFILKNLMRGETFLHINGSYHSDNYEGIIHFITSYITDLKIRTISVVSQESIEKLEEINYDKANFIIVVPNSMTKTY